MNTKRIRQLAAHLRNLPEEQFAMARFTHDCGSPACIAGHAIALFGDRNLLSRTVNPIERWPLLSREASAVLDIERIQAQVLFAPCAPLANAAGRRGTRQYISRFRAADVLDHLADTGQVVW